MKSKYHIRLRPPQIEAFEKYTIENRIMFVCLNIDMGPDEVTSLYYIWATQQEALLMKLSVETISFLSVDKEPLQEFVK